MTITNNYLILLSYQNGIHQSLVGLDFANEPKLDTLGFVDMDDIANYASDSTIRYSVKHSKTCTFGVYLAIEMETVGWDIADYIDVDNTLPYALYCIYKNVRRILLYILLEFTVYKLYNSEIRQSIWLGTQALTEV